MTSLDVMLGRWLQCQEWDGVPCRGRRRTWKAVGTLHTGAVLVFLEGLACLRDIGGAGVTV